MLADPIVEVMVSMAAKLLDANATSVTNWRPEQNGNYPLSPSVARAGGPAARSPAALDGRPGRN